VPNLPLQFRGVLIDGNLIPGNVFSYLSLPDTSTLAQANSALGVWAQAIDGCVDGAFEQVYATIAPTLPDGLKAATGTTWLASRMPQTGVLDFSASGTSRRYGQALPSLSDATLTSGTLDINNAAIQALISLLLNPTGAFTNAQQQSLEAALDALLSFRKYSKLYQRSQEL
jgi:hypothetical protein